MSPKLENGDRASEPDDAYVHTVFYSPNLPKPKRPTLVGPWAGHAFAEEGLPGWIRPSNWYLTSFLIPSDTPAQQRDDSDDDDDFDGEISPASLIPKVPTGK